MKCADWKKSLASLSRQHPSPLNIQDVAILTKHYKANNVFSTKYIGTKTIDITTWLSDCLSAKSIYIAQLKMSMLLQFPVNFQGHKTTSFNSKVHWIARNSFLIKAAWRLVQMPIDQSHQAHACMVRSVIVIDMDMNLASLSHQPLEHIPFFF